MKWQALFVGINRYPYLKESATDPAQNLKVAFSDAEKIAHCFENSGRHLWNVRLLPTCNDDLVTADHLSEEIYQLFPSDTNQAPEVSLLYFAGHGLRKHVEGKNGLYEGFLATSDTNRRTKWGISLSWLRELLLKSQVRKQIIWLDCCYSGELLNFLTEHELKNWLSGGDRLLITACRDNKSAYADQHGVLTQILLNALDPNLHPENESISSYTIKRFIDKELSNNYLIKKQIPLCRHFGEEISFWMGSKQIIESQISNGRSSRRLRKYLDVGCSNIRIIGPRNSGKTTFLATLAYIYNFSQSIVEIELISEDTRKLMDRAENILKEGLRLEPTQAFKTDYIPVYCFLISMRPSLCSNPQATLTRQNVGFSLSCMDYSGEFIQELSKYSTTDYLMEYIDECSFASGIVILIDSTSFIDDLEYATAFQNLEKEMSFRFQLGNRSRDKYRIAVVFSKFDQVYESQSHFNVFINVRFPKTKTVLNKWQNTWRCSVKYFYCSAFGMAGKPPKPNIIDTGYGGSNSVLADPTVWKPFGLLAPIYWLCTGKNDSRLWTI
jgi:hypothetical protein